MDPAATLTQVTPKDLMINYARERKRIRLEALELGVSIREHEDKRNAIRSEIKLAVANETGADGKPLFSNEDKRNAERLRREDAHEELREIEEGLQALHGRLSRIYVDADYYADMIHIGCAFAGVTE